MTRFTAIVPIYQTPAILKLFLDSLCNTLTIDTDIFFINDGSGDTVQSMLFDFSQRANTLCVNVRVTILEHSDSLGAAASINAALSIFDDACDYLVFLDSDTILQGKWQDQLLMGFRSSEIGAIGGVLLYPQTGGIQCCGLTYCGSTGRHLYLNSSPNYLPTNKPFFIQATVFAFCCFRSACIKEIGSLDECFYNGYEDIDYQFRLRRLGYRIVTMPSIRHFHWEKSNGIHREYNRKSNLGRFGRKHGDFVYDDLTDFLQLRLNQAIERTTTTYYAIDLCEGRNDANTVRNWIEKTDLISINCWENATNIRTRQETIWLPEVLDSGRIHSRSPILFLCDQMVQLLDNHYWWSLRKHYNSDDLIIDLYGNVLRFSQLEGCFWPGRKIR